jgi:hypothetical protein
MKLTGFDQLLSDVRDFEAELAAPASFYARHRQPYYQQARRLAEEVLSQLRPPESKREDWKRKVDAVLDRITTDLLAGGDGIVFNFAAPDESVINGERPSTQTMSFEDIKEWIRAGIAGEPGGKRITAIDDKVMREKGVAGVASVVMKAYYSKKPDPRYARLRSAIQRYFLGARAAESSPLLDAVTVAWVEHFSVVIPQDLSKYAADLCRRF